MQYKQQQNTYNSSNNWISKITSPTLTCLATPADITAFDAGSRLEVQHPRWPHSLHLSYPWLRDHCRCGDCFNHVTAQRRFDLTNMQLNIRPARVSATPDGLELQCECHLSLIIFLILSHFSHICHHHYSHNCHQFIIICNISIVFTFT